MLAYELVQVLDRSVPAVYGHDNVAFAVAHFLSEIIHFISAHYNHAAIFVGLDVNVAKSVFLFG